MNQRLYLQKSWPSSVAWLTCCLFLIAGIWATNLNGQCTNTSAFGSAVAPTGASVTTISTCSFQSEFSTITSVIAGNRYEVTGSIAGTYITMRFGTSAGQVVAAGVTPLQFTAPCSGTYFAHWNTNSACGTAGNCMTTTIACSSCGGASSQCTNTSAFGSVVAPTVLNTPSTISTCSFQSENSTLSSVVAARIYTVTGSIAGTFITIRQGTSGGPVIASGVSPLTWTATVAGTYFAHWNTNSACGTAGNCMTTTMAYIGDSPCAFSPPTISSFTPNTNLCTGGGQTITITGTNFTGATSVKFNLVNAASFVVVNSTTITAVTPSGLTAGVINVTNPGGNVNSAAYTVATSPAVAVTPTSSSICSPGGSAVTLTASGASTYAWSPVTGLTPSSGSPVAALPAASTTYTVTGTDGNGCTGTATASITVNNAPSICDLTATPSSVCSGANSQLNVSGGTSAAVNAYTFASGTGTVLNNMVGATQVLNASNDDTPTAAPASIGFNFNYNGTSFSQYSVSPDGWILLGGATATGSFSNGVTLTSNIPKIYPYWDDVATGTTGNVKTLVTGFAPNRIFIVQWFVTIPRNTSGPANSTFQAWLYECGGKIEFRYGAMGPGSMSASVGLTGGATNFQSVTLSPLGVSTTTPNDFNSVQPANGDIYTFTTPSPSWSWSPATFLSSTSIANPMATGVTATTTYTVTATGANGCTSTASVTITAGSALSCNAITASSPICSGSNFTLNSSATGGGAPYTYLWSDGASTTTQNITQNLAAGTYTYTVTVTDACAATCTSSITLTVNQIPTASVTPVGPITVCSNNLPVVLTAAGFTNASFTEGFNAGTVSVGYTPAGWAQQNNSVPVGSTPQWSGGDNTVFAPHSGAGYIYCNYLSTSGANDISNWLMTPTLNFQNGDVLTFWSRTVDAPAFPDRLQVRMSTNGSSTNVGSGAAAVGDFTTLLLDINPTLTTSGYPNVWTQYTITVSGLSGPTSGRFAFRYFVTNGGPLGTNSDYIGLDDVQFTSNINYSYNWSNGATTQATNVNATGSYSVTVSQNGCSVVSTPVSVTVTPSATPPTTSPSTISVCQGALSSPSFTGNCTAAGTQTSTASGATGLPITWTSTLGATSATLPVTAFPPGSTTTNVSVTVNINHTWGGDIVMTLQAPNGGPTLNILNDPNDNNIDFGSAAGVGPSLPYTFNMTGVALPTSGAVVSPGPYSPASSFAGYNGFDPNGTWTLTVSDNVGGDGGTVELLNLTITANTVVAGPADWYSVPTGGTLITSTSSFNPITDGGASTATPGTTNFYVECPGTNGCPSTRAQVSFIVNAVPVLTCGGTNVSCNGGSNGSANVGVTGNGPFTYLWSNSNTNASISGLLPGTYCVTVTDVNGCTATCCYTVTEPSAALAATATATIASCPLCPDGTVTINSVSGGTPPYTFTNLTGLLPGNYCITVTDANGCTTSACATVGAAGCTLTANMSLNNNAPCFGGVGSATVTPGGGLIGPFSYLWDNGNTNATANNLIAGNHTVILSDLGTGCVIQGNINIAQPALLTATCSGTNVSCNGGSDGSASVVAAGGTAPYNYLWSNNSTDASISGLAIGTYCVTITDANGCTASCCYTVTQPAVLNITGSVVNVVCAESPTGGINITPTGGTTPYGYVWSNGATTQNLSGVLKGTYTVTVTDANGCTKSYSNTIICTDNTAPSFGTNTPGNITVHITSVSFADEITWNLRNAANVIVLSGGPYGSGINVTAGPIPSVGGPFTLNMFAGTNFNDNDATFQVICNGNIIATGCVRGASSGQVCGNINTGVITGIVGCQTSNSTCPANITVNNTPGLCGANVTYTVPTATDNCAFTTVGNHNPGDFFPVGTTNVLYTATDGCGNIGTCSFNVIVVDNQAPVITCPGNITADCNGVATYSVTVTDNCSATTSLSAGLASGSTFPVGNTTVTWTAADAAGNTAACSFVVTRNAAVSVSATSTAVLCNGGSTGTATANGAGGFPAYAYVWSDAQVTQTAIGLAAGTYTVTVTDICGATASTTVVVSEPTALTAQCSVIANASCFGGSNGSVNVVGSGGTPAYTISPSTTNLAAGTYTFMVTDANGCTATCAATITQPSQLMANTSTTSSTCANTANGSATSSPTGGVAPYTYLWSNGSTNANAIGLTAGTYTVIVTDANGCTMVGSATITAVSSIPAQPGAITGNVSVCLSSTGNVYSIVAVPGATSYTWSTGSTTATIASGQGTTSIMVSFSGAAVASTISVTANNVCGSSIARFKSYKVTAALTVPGPITGQTTGLCKKINVPYSISSVPGAISYFWAVPSGVSIVSGQGSTAIVVTYGNAFVGTGNITVQAVNSCTMSAPRLLAVSAKAAKPVIIGSNTTCQFQTGVVYSVTPVVGATSYTWTVVPGSSIVSGQGTTSIVVNWGNINGVIQCKGNNLCGSGVNGTLPVSFTCKADGSSLDISELALYPNPTDNMATLDFDAFVDGNATLIISDMIGRVVSTENFDVTEGNNKRTIDVTQYSKGTYLVKVSCEGSTRVVRLMVQ